MKKFALLGVLAVIIFLACTSDEGTGPTEHAGVIDTNETWHPDGNPHIITGDVSVEDNATLTILPGCVVEFDPQTELYAGYNGSGAIIANGLADSIILFTSHAASPSAGDYIGLGLYEYAMNTSSFSYCTIEYAGNSATYGAFHVDGITHARLSNCTIRNITHYGVRAELGSGFQSFTGNTVTGCGDYPVYVHAEYIRTLGAGNTMTGNTNNAVYVHGGTVATTGTWLNQGVPYVLGGSIDIGDNNTNPVLTIAAGTTIKFQPDVELYAGYSGAGGIIADGSTGRITFTSNVASPANGDWYNIGFYEYSIDASCKLIDCNILYGGGSTGYPGLVYIDDALPEITGDSIGHSGNYGIFLSGSVYPDSAGLEANNIFYDCPSGNVGK